jgi:hypothetical protein
MILRILVFFHGGHTAGENIVFCCWTLISVDLQEHSETPSDPERTGTNIHTSMKAKFSLCFNYNAINTNRWLEVSLHVFLLSALNESDR